MKKHHGPRRLSQFGHNPTRDPYNEGYSREEEPISEPPGFLELMKDFGQSQFMKDFGKAFRTITALAIGCVGIIVLAPIILPSSPIIVGGLVAATFVGGVVATALSSSESDPQKKSTHQPPEQSAAHRDSLVPPGNSLPNSGISTPRISSGQPARGGNSR